MYAMKRSYSSAFNPCVVARLTVLEGVIARVLIASYCTFLPLFFPFVNIIFHLDAFLFHLLGVKQNLIFPGENTRISGVKRAALHDVPDSTFINVGGDTKPFFQRNERLPAGRFPAASTRVGVTSTPRAFDSLATLTFLNNMLAVHLSHAVAACSVIRFGEPYDKNNKHPLRVFASCPVIRISEPYYKFLFARARPTPLPRQRKQGYRYPLAFPLKEKFLPSSYFWSGFDKTIQRRGRFSSFRGKPSPL